MLIADECSGIRNPSARGEQMQVSENDNLEQQDSATMPVDGHVTQSGHALEHRLGLFAVRLL